MKYNEWKEKNMEKIYEIIARNFRKVMFSIIMILLIISFGMWGVSDVVRKLSSTKSEVAEVAGSKLSNEDIDTSFRQYLRILGNGNTISIEDGIRAGLLEQSVKRITSEIALNKEAKNVGIEVSDDLIVKIIKEDPYFQDNEGKFNKELFLRVAAYSGYSNERGFLEALKKEKARLLLLNIVQSGVSEMKYKQDLLTKYDNEIRSADYIFLPFEPNKVSYKYEDLQEYYKENIDQYLTPEFKDISILVISRDSFKDENLSDEEIEDEVLAKVNIADDLLVEDISLEDISAELGIEIDNLKNVDIVNPDEETKSIKGIREILGTVNDMSVSGDRTVSEIRETSNGDFYIVRIDAIKGKDKLPLEEVKEDVIKAYIKDTSEESKRKEIVDLVKAINAGETTIKDVSAKYGIKLKSITDIHRRPDMNSDNENKDILSPIVLAQIFSKENIGDAGLAIRDNGVVLFTLSNIDYKVADDNNSQYNKRDKEYLMVESFADALLAKYKAKVNYKLLDKMYNINDDIK